MRLDALLDDAPLPATPDGGGRRRVRGRGHRRRASTRRAVRPGALFCCVRGSRVDGHDLAGRRRRRRRGRRRSPSARLDLPDGVAQVVVPDVRAAMGPLAAALHGHPSRSLTVVGVTGTNGKTTTTHLLRLDLRRRPGAAAG